MPVERALLLLTKPSVPGRVKTRLAGRWGAAAAAALHRGFLSDLTARFAADDRFELVIWWALEGAEEPPESEVATRRQIAGDLGDRLADALFRSLAERRVAIAIGSDCPELSIEIVRRAFDEIERGADVVLGPAADGGYYLIGLSREAFDPRLFAGIRWSSSEVLATTRQRAAELGLGVVELPLASDVDTPDDVEALRARLAARPLACCPATRAALAELAERMDAADPEAAAPPVDPATGLRSVEEGPACVS